MQTGIAALQGNSVLALGPYLTVDTTNKLVLLQGVNLQLVNGANATYSRNGLGNLILGYNLPRNDSTYFCSNGLYLTQDDCTGAGETWAVSHQTGSHYLVIGDYNNYSQFTGIVVGQYNTGNGPVASVSGGAYNTASGWWASVSGGAYNAALANSASVSGGQHNTASGGSASVSGGYRNTATANWASVSGGELNAATEEWASVSGGIRNTANGEFASVSGGGGNTAAGIAASVSGGAYDTASGDYASVSGGNSRQAILPYNWAAGSLAEPQ